VYDAVGTLINRQLSTTWGRTVDGRLGLLTACGLANPNLWTKYMLVTTTCRNVRASLQLPQVAPRTDLRQPSQHCWPAYRSPALADLEGLARRQGDRAEVVGPPQLLDHPTRVTPRRHLPRDGPEGVSGLDRDDGTRRDGMPGSRRAGGQVGRQQQQAAGKGDAEGDDQSAPPGQPDGPGLGVRGTGTDSTGAGPGRQGRRRGRGLTGNRAPAHSPGAATRSASSATWSRRAVRNRWDQPEPGPGRGRG
jgi:hypothetical protein